MQILFPLVECVIPEGSHKLVANPKAIAFQTFKSRSLNAPFYMGKAWAEYADIFRFQFLISAAQAPAIDVPAVGDWIAYPYALLEGIFHCECVVWIEEVPPPTLRHFRHVRFYPDSSTAERDNNRIANVIGKGFSGVTVLPLNN